MQGLWQLTQDLTLLAPFGLCSYIVQQLFHGQTILTIFLKYHLHEYKYILLRFLQYDSDPAVHSYDRDSAELKVLKKGV